MEGVSSRSSSSGMLRYCMHSSGPPWSRAISAVAAARPPPALLPATPMCRGSMPSSAAFLARWCQHGEAVAQARRERMLGSETVLHRHHHDLRGGGDLPRPGIVAVHAADDKPAAVDVHQAGQDLTAPGGCVNAHRDIGIVRQARHQPVSNGQRDGQLSEEPRRAAPRSRHARGPDRTGPPRASPRARGPVQGQNGTSSDGSLKSCPPQASLDLTTSVDLRASRVDARNTSRYHPAE